VPELKGPPVHDSGAVQETLANGPTNVSIFGALAQFTFTHIRPNAKDAFDAKENADLVAHVVARIVVPVEALAGLRDLLNRMVTEGPPAGTVPN
jgi:hypothetical protein